MASGASIEDESLEKLATSVPGMMLTKLGFVPMASIGDAGGIGSLTVGIPRAAAVAANGEGSGFESHLREMTFNALAVPPGRPLSSREGVVNGKLIEKRATEEGYKDSAECASVIEMGLGLEQLAEILKRYQS